MQLECHYYGTYYMARLAGFSPDDAKVIAWAAETVDELDFNRVRALKEKGVKIPYFVTVEAISESVDDQFNYLLNTRGKIGNTEIRTMMRGIWAPFHFLPGNFAGAVEADAVWPYEGKTSIRMGVQSQSVLCDNTETDSNFFHVPVEGSTCGEDMKLLCRTSTETVRAIIENAKTQFCRYYNAPQNGFRASRYRLRALCAVGICMHVLADTWSHQDFAGTPSMWVNDCEMLKDDMDVGFYFGDVTGIGSLFSSIKNGIMDYLSVPTVSLLGSKFDSDNVNSPLFVGHGIAGNLPDIPGATWHVKHAYRKNEDCIDNRSRFASGFLQMYDALKYIRDGLSENARAPFRFRRMEDGEAALPRNSDDLRVYNELRCIEIRTLNNVSSATDERIDLWKAFLEEQGETLPEYAFDEAKVIPFVEMARIHRKVVCDFLRETDSGIRIDPDLVDEIIKKELIYIFHSEADYSDVDAREFDDLSPKWEDPASRTDPKREPYRNWLSILDPLLCYVAQEGRTGSPEKFCESYLGVPFSEAAANPEQTEQLRFLLLNRCAPDGTLRPEEQTDDRVRKLEALLGCLREPQTEFGGFFPETEHLIRSRNIDPKLLAGDLLWFLAGRRSAAVLNQIYSAVTAAG